MTPSPVADSSVSPLAGEVRIQQYRAGTVRWPLLRLKVDAWKQSVGLLKTLTRPLSMAATTSERLG